MIEQDLVLVNRIADIRKKHHDTIYFYGDLTANQWYIEENDYLPIELMEQGQNLLLNLYNGPWVEAADMGKIINLYERIMQGTREPIHMENITAHFYMKNRKGKTDPVIMTCYLEENSAGYVTAFVGKLRPLREKEIESREIVSKFSNDKSPEIFINRIAKFMEANPERLYAFIQFDIRNFRYINDTYGSQVGDEILKYICDTLDVMCDQEHLHCRLSADLYEIVTYYNNKEEILDFIEVLDSRLHRCGDIRFNMKYGISIAPGTSKEFRKHGDEAGLARVYTKNTVLKKAAFYEETLLQDVISAGMIEEVEEEALKNREFQVYLQPKFIYNKKRSRLAGAEALVRWLDRKQNVKSPAEFIPVFEQNGFILKLDQFMWESVCKLLRHWLDEGKNPVPISVNISRSYLGKTDIVNFLKGLIEKYQIPISLLQLEITETVENEETIHYINELKDAGFTLMMDDFGSGYSSLSMLKDTPFDVLKMDRLFLDKCLENKQGQAIVSHVISMSNDLGLEIIAEGVETKEQADFLYDSGCEISQGYYFSKPISVKEFERLFYQNDGLV